MNWIGGIVIAVLVGAASTLAVVTAQTPGTLQEHPRHTVCDMYAGEFATSGQWLNKGKIDRASKRSTGTYRLHYTACVAQFQMRR